MGSALDGIDEFVPPLSSNDPFAIHTLQRVKEGMYSARDNNVRFPRARFLPRALGADRGHRADSQLYVGEHVEYSMF